MNQTLLMQIALINQLLLKKNLFLLIMQKMVIVFKSD